MVRGSHRVVAASAALAVAVLTPHAQAAPTADAGVVGGTGSASPGYGFGLPDPQSVSFTFSSTCEFSGSTTGSFFEEDGTVHGICFGGSFVGCRYLRAGTVATLVCPGVTDGVVIGGTFVWQPNDVLPTTSFTLTGVLVRVL